MPQLARLEDRPLLAADAYTAADYNLELHPCPNDVLLPANNRKMLIGTIRTDEPLLLRRNLGLLERDSSWRTIWHIRRFGT